MASNSGRAACLWSLLPVVALIALGGALGWRAAVSLPSRSNAAEACQQVRFEGSRFTLCTYDPARHEMRLALRARDGSIMRDFKRLAQDSGVDAQRISFAMNAGMYGLDGQPIGLYVENGSMLYPLNQRDAGGNFYMKPNGVFWLDAAGVHVATTQSYARLPAPQPRLASQSGPMLVINGRLHPDFQDDGPSRKTRNGVGLCAQPKVIFAISEDPVSFGRFARLFRDRLRCPDALYFDGTVSALWNAAEGRTIQPYPLGPMLVVMDKPRQGD